MPVYYDPDPGLLIEVDGVGIVSVGVGQPCVGVFDPTDPAYHPPGGTDCSYPQLPDGTPVTATAQALPLWPFSHWRGSCSGTEPSTSFKVASAKCVAVFVYEPEDAGSPDALDDASDAGPMDASDVDASDAGPMPSDDAGAMDAGCLAPQSFCIGVDGGPECCGGTCYANACCLPPQATCNTSFDCCPVPPMNFLVACTNGKCCGTKLAACAGDSYCCDLPCSGYPWLPTLQVCAVMPQGACPMGNECYDDVCTNGICCHAMLSACSTTEQCCTPYQCTGGYCQ
jgi:hypothetical protein